MLTSDYALHLLQNTEGAYLWGGNQIHYKLVSGLHSEEYLHLRLALQEEETLLEFARDLAHQVGRQEINAVVSFTKGGSLLGGKLANLLTAIHVAGVRLKVGDRQRVTFPQSELKKLQPGHRVLLVDDVLTTGGSIGEAIKQLEDTRGCKLAALGIGWDRSDRPISIRNGTGNQVPILSAVKKAIKNYVPDARGLCALCGKGLPLIDLSNPDEDTLSIVRSMSKSVKTHMSDTKVFISHSGKNKDLADSFVAFLMEALEMDASQIRCTSVDSTALRPSDRVSEQIRLELLAAPVFIALLTRHSLRSQYVLFELGARWGSKRPICPLVGPDQDRSKLRAPLSELHAGLLTSAADLHSVLKMVSNDCAVKMKSPATVQNAINTFRGRLVT